MPSSAPAPEPGVSEAPAASGPTTHDSTREELARATQAAQSLQLAVPGEYLVKFKAGTSGDAAARALRKVALEPVREFRSVPGLRLVRAAHGQADGVLLKAELVTDPGIEYIEPNFIYDALSVPNDSNYPRQWAMHNTGQSGRSSPYTPDISAEAAWDITTGSDDVVVAVIDTGVDYRHPDLAANIWSNPTDCDADGIDDDGNGYVDDCHGIDTAEDDSDPMDGHYHGTHVAGIIGAVGNNGFGVAGVAWHVKILPCRFLNSAGRGTTEGAIRCLDYLALMKERGVQLVASNNSWGGAFHSRALEDAIRAQLDREILFVAAAGNDLLQDVDANPKYPCAYDLANLICVASVYESFDNFSNLGRAKVLLGAPGADILSTVPGSRYQPLSGTSMATPHVTGALVLLKAQDPSRNLWALRNLLAAGAVPSREATLLTATEGRLNLFNSLSCANRTVLARLQPMNFAPVSRSPGDRVTIRALHANCAAPAGDVTVTVMPGGELVQLRDDGVDADEFAGDAVYSAVWTAHGDGEYTFAFPAPETDTFVVDVDPNLEPGFPLVTTSIVTPNMILSAGGGAALVVGNVTGDEGLEIASLSPIFGPLTVWNARGQRLAGWPQQVLDYALSLTLGNFDADPATLEPNAQLLFGMREYLGDGSPIAGWPQSAGTILATLSAADLDGDGIDEILAYPARRNDGSAFRSDVAVPARSTDITGFSQGVKAGDLDADGRVDLVAIEIPVPGIPTQLWISDADGVRPGFPVPMPGGRYIYSAVRPLIGDVDGDGIPNIVIGAVDDAGARGQVHILDNRGRLLRTLYTPSFRTDNLALADVDGDGIPEIVKVAESQVEVWHGDGTSLPGWPRPVAGTQLAGEAAIGDVDGDGGVDIVVAGFKPERPGFGHEGLHVFHADGTYLPGFPRPVVAEAAGASTPVIADIDSDGRNELIVAYGRGAGLRETIFAYDLHGAGPYGRIEWSQDSGDARHTGYYQTGRYLPNHAYLATQVYGAGRITSSDGGIDCKRDCIERYAKGTQVVLTAAPLAGSAFRRWRGACANQGNPCILPMQRFTETSADFDNRITVSVTGDGMVTSDLTGIRCPADCEKPFVGRSMVTLTAVPTATSGLVAWSGACNGAEPTCRVFIDEAKNVGASFANELPLTVTKSGAGTADVTVSSTNIHCGATCTANVPPRARVTVSIAPAPDTYVVTWHRPECRDRALTCEITVDRPMSLDLSFAIKPVITMAINGKGRIVAQPSGLACDANCVFRMEPGIVTLTAIPADSGWQFEHFEGLCNDFNFPTCTLYFDSDDVVTAVFTARPGGGGTSSGSGTNSPSRRGGGGSLDPLLLFTLALLVAIRRRIIRVHASHQAADPAQRPE